MEGLPTEVLVDCILCYLSLPDICKCRLVSRRINDVGSSSFGRRGPLAEIHSDEIGLKFLSIFGHSSYRWRLDLKPLKLSLDILQKIAEIFGPTVREYRLRFHKTPSHLPLFAPVQRGILRILLENSAAPRLEVLVIWSQELYTPVTEHCGSFNFPNLRTLKLGLNPDRHGEGWMNHSTGSDFLAVNLLSGAPKLQQLCFFETPGWNTEASVLERLQGMGPGNIAISYIPNVYAHIPRALVPISASINHLRLNIRSVVINRPATRAGPRIPAVDLQCVLTPMETFEFLESTAPNLTFLQIRIAGSLRSTFQFPVFPLLETLILDEGDNYRGYSPVTSANFPQLLKLTFVSNVSGISNLFHGSFQSVQQLYMINEDEGGGGVYGYHRRPPNLELEYKVAVFLRNTFPNLLGFHVEGIHEVIDLDVVFWLQNIVVGPFPWLHAQAVCRLESLELGTLYSFRTLSKVIDSTRKGEFRHLNYLKISTKPCIPFSWILVQMLRCTHFKAVVRVKGKDDPGRTIRDNMTEEFLSW